MVNKLIMKRLVSTILFLFASSLFACQNNVTPRQGFKRAEEITVVEKTEFGRLMKGDAYIDILTSSSTKYFTNTLEEITKGEFNEKDHFYVYYERWDASYPATLHVIYMYES